MLLLGVSDMVKTKIIWENIRQLDLKTQSEILNKVEQLSSQKKAINNSFNLSEIVTESAEGDVVIRTWASREAAAEWIEFISAYNPKYAAIIDD
jgi:hypothetical protein